MKAIEAGADMIDTALSPFAEGTSQPPTEPIAFAFKGTEYDLGLDLDFIKRSIRILQAYQREIHCQRINGS